jgi:aminoglycoside phosphotransferase family enzyme
MFDEWCVPVKDLKTANTTLTLEEEVRLLKRAQYELSLEVKRLSDLCEKWILLGHRADRGV